MIIDTTGLTRFEVLKALTLRAIFKRDITHEDVMFLDEFVDHDVDSAIIAALDNAESTENYSFAEIIVNKVAYPLIVNLTDRASVNVTEFDSIYGNEAGMKSIAILKNAEYKDATDASHSATTPMCWTYYSQDGRHSRAASSLSTRSHAQSVALSSAALSPPSVNLYGRSPSGETIVRSLSSLSNTRMTPSLSPFSLDSDRAPTPTRFGFRNITG